MAADGSLIFQIIFLFILVGINAFFASSEIAIISLNDKKIKKMAEDGHKKAKIIDGLISEPSRFLATIQVGVTLSGLLASALASESFADRITTLVVSMNVPVDRALIKVISIVLITIILSYLTLVFGELIPKRLAMQNPESISMFSAGPLSFLSRVTKPFVWLLTFSTNAIIRLFGGDPDINDENISEEEIRLMVDVGEERGVIQNSEREMIVNIFEFDDTTASEIMTHRTEIIAVPLDSDYNRVIKLSINEQFTRYPVYEDTIDNIVGTLHVKDLLQYADCENPELFTLEDIVRKPYFIPESKKIDDLFRELQKNKTHMAIVIDEYGGTAGLVTAEDLLEEIVGNIFDEYDVEEKEIEKLDESTYVIDGTVSLDRIVDTLEAALPVDEYDTLGGFVMGQLGRVPENAEKPEIEFNGVVFKVEQVEDKRISRVKVCKAE